MASGPPDTAGEQDGANPVPIADEARQQQPKATVDDELKGDGNDEGTASRAAPEPQAGSPATTTPAAKAAAFHGISPVPHDADAEVSLDESAAKAHAKPSTTATSNGDDLASEPSGDSGIQPSKSHDGDQPGAPAVLEPPVVQVDNLVTQLLAALTASGAGGVVGNDEALREQAAAIIRSNLRVLHNEQSEVNSNLAKRANWAQEKKIEELTKQNSELRASAVTSEQTAAAPAPRLASPKDGHEVRRVISQTELTANADGKCSALKYGPMGKYKGIAKKAGGVRGKGMLSALKSDFSPAIHSDVPWPVLERWHDSATIMLEHEKEWREPGKRERRHSDTGGAGTAGIRHQAEAHEKRCHHVPPAPESARKGDESQLSLEEAISFLRADQDSGGQTELFHSMEDDGLDDPAKDSDSDSSYDPANGETKAATSRSFASRSTKHVSKPPQKMAARNALRQAVDSTTPRSAPPTPAAASPSHNAMGATIGPAASPSQQPQDGGQDDISADQMQDLEELDIGSDEIISEPSESDLLIDDEEPPSPPREPTMDKPNTEMEQQYNSGFIQFYADWSRCTKRVESINCIIGRLFTAVLPGRTVSRAKVIAASISDMEQGVLISCAQFFNNARKQASTFNYEGEDAGDDPNGFGKHVVQRVIHPDDPSTLAPETAPVAAPNEVSGPEPTLAPETAPATASSEAGGPKTTLAPVTAHMHEGQPGQEEVSSSEYGFSGEICQTILHGVPIRVAANCKGKIVRRMEKGELFACVMQIKMNGRIMLESKEGWIVAVVLQSRKPDKIAIKNVMDAGMADRFRLAEMMSIAEGEQDEHKIAEMGDDQPNAKHVVAPGTLAAQADGTATTNVQVCLWHECSNFCRPKGGAFIRPPDCDTRYCCGDCETKGNPESGESTQFIVVDDSDLESSEEDRPEHECSSCKSKFKIDFQVPKGTIMSCQKCTRAVAHRRNAITGWMLAEENVEGLDACNMPQLKSLCTVCGLTQVGNKDALLVKLRACPRRPAERIRALLMPIGPPPADEEYVPAGEIQNVFEQLEHEQSDPDDGIVDDDTLDLSTPTVDPEGKGLLQRSRKLPKSAKERSPKEIADQLKQSVNRRARDAISDDKSRCVRNLCSNFRRIDEEKGLTYRCCTTDCEKKVRRRGPKCPINDCGRPVSYDQLEQKSRPTCESRVCRKAHASLKMQEQRRANAVQAVAVAVHNISLPHSDDVCLMCQSPLNGDDVCVVCGIDNEPLSAGSNDGMAGTTGSDSENVDSSSGEDATIRCQFDKCKNVFQWDRKGDAPACCSKKCRKAQSLQSARKSKSPAIKDGVLSSRKDNPTHSKIRTKGGRVVKFHTTSVSDSEASDDESPSSSDEDDVSSSSDPDSSGGGFKRKKSKSDGNGGGGSSSSSSSSSSDDGDSSSGGDNDDDSSSGDDSDDTTSAEDSTDSTDADSEENESDDSDDASSSSSDDEVVVRASRGKRDAAKRARAKARSKSKSKSKSPKSKAKAREKKSRSRSVHSKAHEVSTSMTVSRLESLINDKAADLSTGKDSKLSESKRLKLVKYVLQKKSKEIEDSEAIIAHYSTQRRKAVRAQMKSVKKATFKTLSKKTKRSAPERVMRECDSYQKQHREIILSCRNDISSILARAYNIPRQRNVSADAHTLSSLKQGDVLIPKKMSTSDVDASKVHELMIRIRAVAHSHPSQMWAVIPVLERIFAEINKKVRWTPTTVDRLNRSASMFYKCKQLKKEYVQQTSALYDLLIKCDRVETRKATRLLRLATMDGTDHKDVYGVKADGVSIIFWWLAKHLQYGYAEEDSILNTFVFSHAAFDRGSVVKSAIELDEMTEMAEQMEIELSWGKVVTQTARTIAMRHSTFRNPMEQWYKHTGPQGGKRQDPSNCLNRLPDFYAEIKFLAEQVAESELQDAVSVMRRGTRAFYTKHRDHAIANKGSKFGSSPAKSSQPRDETVSSIQCARDNCFTFLPQGMVDTLGLKKNGNGICTLHFKELYRDGEIPLKDGTKRFKTTDSGAGKSLTRATRAYVAAGYASGYDEEASPEPELSTPPQARANKAKASKKAKLKAKRQLKKEKLKSDIEELGRLRKSAGASPEHASDSSDSDAPVTKKQLKASMKNMAKAVDASDRSTARAAVARHREPEADPDDGSVSECWERTLKEDPPRRARHFMMRAMSTTGCDTMFSTPPDNKENAWWPRDKHGNRPTAIELMIDSAATDVLVASAIQPSMRSLRPSDLSVTGITGEAEEAGQMGSLHVECFSSKHRGKPHATRRGAVSLRPVHTLIGANANLISEWYITTILGFSINKTPDSVTISRTEDNGDVTIIPAERYPGARCWIIRGVVAYDPFSAKLAVTRILDRIDAGKKWMWGAFDKQSGFLTEPLTMAYIAKNSRRISTYSKSGVDALMLRDMMDEQDSDSDSDEENDYLAPEKSMRGFLSVHRSGCGTKVANLAKYASNEDALGRCMTARAKRFAEAAIRGHVMSYATGISFVNGQPEYDGIGAPGSMRLSHDLHPQPEFACGEYSCIQVIDKPCATARGLQGRVTRSASTASAVIDKSSVKAQPSSGKPAATATVDSSQTASVQVEPAVTQPEPSQLQPKPRQLQPEPSQLPGPTAPNFSDEPEPELATPDEIQAIIDEYDTCVLAVKAMAPGKAKRESWLHHHRLLGHVGPWAYNGVICTECAAIKGSYHRVPTKVDPYVPLKAGYYFCTDILTVNVVSRHGRCYAMVTRCLGSGWYAPHVYLEYKSDATRAFCAMILDLRADPRYQHLGFPIMQHLIHDQGGEMISANWKKSIKALGILEQTTPAEDKRMNAAAEAAIKHIEQIMKANMLYTRCPFKYWEEQANHARWIRNRVPITRNINSKDGDTIRPEEEMTKGFISRNTLIRELSRSVTPGMVCLVFMMHIIGSNLVDNKGGWMMSLGIDGAMNRFLNMKTGREMSSRSFLVYELPVNMNAFQFTGHESPKYNLGGKHIANNVLKNDHVVVLDGLIDLLNANGGLDKPIQVTTTRAHGVKPAQVYVVDKGSGKKFVMDESDMLVELHTDTDPAVPTSKVTLAIPPNKSLLTVPITDSEREAAMLLRDPYRVEGRELYKQFFAEEDGKFLGDFKGMVTSTFILAGEGQRWKVLFSDGETEDMTYEQIVHHVLEGWVSLMHSTKPYRRTDASIVTSQLAHAAPIGKINGMADPYARVARDELDITAPRDIVFSLEHIMRNTAAIFTAATNTSWSQLCAKHLRLPHKHHRLFKNWCGKMFDCDAPVPQHDALGCRFPTKWEGGSRKVKKFVKKGCRIPMPEGASWIQWVAEHDRSVDNTTQALDKPTRQALGFAARQVHRGHKLVIAHQLRTDGIVYDLNPDNLGEPPSEAEMRRGRGMISTGEWLKFMGDRATPEQAKALTDPETGQIRDPKDIDDVESRPDADDFKRAATVELTAIHERDTFSAPMRLADIRKLGIRNKPVDCGAYYTIKVDPTGKYAKHKCRYCLKGHAGNLTYGENYWETFSASPNAATERILMFLVAQFGFIMSALDVSCAYLYGKVEPEERVPCRLAKGHRSYDPDTGEELFLVLLGSLYGHPSSGRRWSIRRNNFLLGPVFNNETWTCRKCRYDAALFIFTHTVKVDGHDIVYKAFSSIFTDDVSTVAQRQEEVDYIENEFRKEFGIKKTNPEHMLGLLRKITDGGTAVEITMDSYISGVHEQFKDEPAMTTRSPTTPLPPGTFLSRSDFGKPKDEFVPGQGGSGTYQPKPAATPEPEQRRPVRADFPRFGKLVGCLLWIMRMAKPEIACAVHMLCRMVSEPTEEAWKSGLYVLKYCFCSKTKGIKMRRVSGTPVINTWYDASNKGDPASKGRAISGHIVYIGNSPIEWRSNLNSHCGTSAQHNEYQGMAAATKSTNWIRFLTYDMGFRSWSAKPSPLMGDNNACITLARDDILTHGNRFYTPDLHYNKESIEQGRTCARKVGTEMNVSDMMTKMTATSTFLSHVNMVTGYMDLPEIPPPPHR